MTSKHDNDFLSGLDTDKTVKTGRKGKPVRNEPMILNEADRAGDIAIISTIESVPATGTMRKTYISISEDMWQHLGSQSAPKSICIAALLEYGLAKLKEENKTLMIS